MPRVTLSRSNLRRCIPVRYRPASHFALFGVIGVAGIWIALLQIAQIGFLDWVAVPMTILWLNVLEYLAHRYVMHVRRWWLPHAHEAHSRRHHVFFDHQHMHCEREEDLWLVHFSAKDSLLLVTLTIPAFVGLGLVLSDTALALVASTSIVYFLIYEGVHLCCHLRAEHPIARCAVVALWRDIHRVHHEPARALQCNFNVVFPFGDLLFRTWRAP